MNNTTLIHSSTNDVDVHDMSYGTFIYWFVYFNQITRIIIYWYLLIVTPFGVIFNLLALIVYTRPNLNATTIGLYNQAISVGNVLALVFGMLMYSGLYISFDFSSHSDQSCQSVMYLRKVARQLSPMTEALFTFDRYLCVVYPTRYAFMRKKSTAIALILSFVPLILVANIENFMFYKDTAQMMYFSVQSNITRTILHHSCKGSIELTIASDVILDVFRCLFPLIFTSILNVLIIRKLQKSSRACGTNRACLSSLRESKDRQFARTLVLLNVCFALFNLPQSILYLMKDTYYYMFGQDYAYVIIEFAWSIAFNFGSLHFDFALFFYINYHFNHLFRGEVRTMFFRNPRLGADSISKNRVADSTRTCNQQIR